MSDDSIRLLKALSEKTRYDIIRVLSEGELCACELPELIGKTQSNTSMHLSKLLDLQILEFRKEGKRVIYRIKDKNALQLYSFMKKRFEKEIIV